MAEDQHKPKFPWWMAAILLVVALCIATGGVWFAIDHSRGAREGVGNDLLVTGRLKAEQIANWRAERLGDAGAISATPSTVAVIERWLSSRKPDDAAQIIALFKTLEQQYGYTDVHLVNPDGMVLLGPTQDGESLMPMALEGLRTALSDKKPVLTDLHFGEDGKTIHLDAIAPLFSATDPDAHPLGAVVLTANAGGFLFPLIQTWPTASSSAETLLVERQGDNVLFLNELRHRAGTALVLTIPLAQRELPASQAVLGVRGVVEGRDYRGVEVLAAVQSVPDSPWYIVAKVDTSEAFSGALMRSVLTILLAALLVAALVGGVLLTWQRGLKRHYQEAYHAEVSRLALLARYEHLVQQANDIILVADENMQLLEANERAVESFGFTREELLRLRIPDLIPPEGMADFELNMQELKKGGSHISEGLQRRKDGSVFPVEISARVVLVDGKECVQGIIRDLSERKRAETLLRLTQYSVDHATDSVFWTDADGNFLFVSDSTCRRHGYSRDEFLTMTLFDLNPTLPREQWDREWEMIKGGETLELETTHRTKDGEVFPVEVHSSYLEFDGQGYNCVFARDITERKQAEDALRASEEQLRQSQKMEAVGQLAGGIAHDFNNLLTAIIGYCELLLSNPELADSSAREDLREIKLAAERAAALTMQILAFSRRQALRPAVVSLNKILTGMEPLLRRTLGEDIDLVSRLDPESGHVEVDAHQFEQVLMNLAVNARDAMRSGGRLTLETGNTELDAEYSLTHPEVVPGSYVMLAVSDTGAGMEEATREHIFEPFFTTKQTGEGTGLGLSTVYGIVKQSGGSISVYSEPGRGTSFKIYLPRVPAHDAAAEVVLPKHIPSGGHEVVMVVEDEPSLRSLAERVLGSAGYGVVSFGSADEAAVALDQGLETVDLLLTDVVLPGAMQGRDLYERVQASRPDLPVLFMSGYTRNTVVHAGRLDEGVNLLEKPFTPEMLVSTVRQVLDQARPST